MEHTVTYNVISQLHMPKLIRNCMIDDDKHMLNLKYVIHAHKTSHYNNNNNIQYLYSAL